MGHLINPISTRLAFSSFWLSSWADFSTTDFSYNLMLDKGLSGLLDWVFIHSWFAQSLTKIGIFLSHYRLIRRGGRFKVHCFLVYNSALVLKSSFVETGLSRLNTEWSTDWLKKNFLKKVQVRDFLVLSKSSKFIKALPGTADGSVGRGLLGELEESVKASRKLLIPSAGVGRRGSDLKKVRLDSSSRLNLLYRKTVLNKLLSSLNLFFSVLLSSVIGQFFFKIKVSRFKQVSVGIKFLDNFSLINPQFLARFIARRVSYGFPLQRVLKPLIRDLSLAMSKRKTKIFGFRIACSGRFDRKQIASYVWQKFGPVSLNKFSTNINYGFATAYLKYGTCGIKVWVASKHGPLSSQLVNRLVCLKTLSKLKDMRPGSNFSLHVHVLKYLFILKIFDLLVAGGGSESILAKQIFEKQLLSDFELSKNGLADFTRLQLLINAWLRYENKSLSFQNSSER